MILDFKKWELPSIDILPFKTKALYFLYKGKLCDENILYVGRSVGIRERLQRHHLRKELEIERIFIDTDSYDDESYHILSLYPKLNKECKPGQPGVMLKRIFKIVGLKLKEGV